MVCRSCGTATGPIPNRGQVQALARAFGCARVVFNEGLLGLWGEGRAETAGGQGVDLPGLWCQPRS
ncbi:MULTISPECIES: helix-turn-helix domain-containing protein [Parafrankia]|uniref:helix-turn-helix domain-containing protein n=1 Tax=Parafrankia TaxID=2994362 RepID=UPI000A960762